MAETNKKFLDENGLLYYHGKNKEALAKKVDKVDGKDLSTNDYTTAEKNKLATIAENANNYELPVATANTLGGIKVGDRLNVAADGTLSATVQETIVDSALSDTSANPVQNKVIKAELDKKVTAISGKGLSTNDYTTTEKNKLSGITAGAQVNVIESIKVNGTAQTVSSKAVDITVPTDNSQLANGAGYITSAAIADKEDSSNKVTVLSADSTNVEYPGAKLVYDELAKKVNAVSGKGLSTNDYTTTEKNKLKNIAENAQVNIIETVAVNGTNQTITNKKIDISVPTKVSDIDNDTGFITSSDISGKENTSNKVTSITSTSTDTQYPSAKAVYTGLNGKVDKVNGKGLSTNDYTTAEKNKLGGIATGAQVNVIENVKVNGTALTITDKGVNVTVPTALSQLTNDGGYAKTSEIPTDNAGLTNGAGYQNATQVQSAIDAALSSVTGLDFQIVETLPSAGQGKKGVIYLLAHQHGSDDTYDEYIWLKGDSAAGTVDRFEKIGSTDIDLSAYWNDTNLTVISNADIDKIIAK